MGTNYSIELFKKNDNRNNSKNRNNNNNRYTSNSNNTSLKCIYCGGRVVDIKNQLCIKHQNQLKKLGTFEARNDMRSAKGRGLCSIKGCNSNSSLNGLCRIHYRSFVKHKSVRM